MRRVDALSDDARILLRMIGRRPGLTGGFRTEDVLGLHPYHPRVVAGAAASDGPACAPMGESEVELALDELCGPRGWLGSFRPGAYVFRALNPDIPEDGCNPDHHASRIVVGGDAHALTVAGA